MQGALVLGEALVEGLAPGSGPCEASAEKSLVVVVSPRGSSPSPEPYGEHSSFLNIGTPKSAS